MRLLGMASSSMSLLAACMAREHRLLHYTHSKRALIDRPSRRLLVCIKWFDRITLDTRSMSFPHVQLQAAI
jgi:hypothetical protein